MTAEKNDYQPNDFVRGQEPILRPGERLTKDQLDELERQAKEDSYVRQSGTFPPNSIKGK